MNVKMIIIMKHAKYANTDHEEDCVISFSLVVNKVMLKHSSEQCSYHSNS